MEADYHRHDISDKVWEKLEPHLPGQKGQWGGIAQDNRLFINAVFWILRTGAPWRDLPPDYGKWGTVHQRFIRWRNSGFWEELLFILVDLDSTELKWLMIDASHIKVHPHASGAVGGNQDMEGTKGGLTPRYIWPWPGRALRLLLGHASGMRMVCRLDVLSQLAPWLIVQRLWTYWKA